MALFKKDSATPDAPAATGGGSVATREKVEAEPGPHAAECMKMGQLLVDREQLTTDKLATALQTANGDALQFADVVLGRFGVGRQDLASVIAEVWGVVAADTKAVEFNAEIAALVSEQTARQNCVVPIAEENGTVVILSADPSPQRREVVERLVEKPVRWMSADPQTIRTFIDRSYRADAAEA
eukprot:gene17880-36544_t